MRKEKRGFLTQQVSCTPQAVFPCTYNTNRTSHLSVDQSKDFSLVIFTFFCDLCSSYEWIYWEPSLILPTAQQTKTLPALTESQFLSYKEMSYRGTKNKTCLKENLNEQKQSNFPDKARKNIPHNKRANKACQKNGQIEKFLIKIECCGAKFPMNI